MHKAVGGQRAGRMRPKHLWLWVTACQRALHSDVVTRVDHQCFIDRQFQSRWGCGVGELEGDRFIRDAADIADGHLARVAGVILGPQVLQLQDFGFTLCVEGFVDVHAIVLTVGKRLSSPFPYEASWRVGVDGTTEEDSLLLVEAATYVTDGLVNSEDRFI